MRLTPRGGREAIDGWAIDGGGRPYLKVRVAAPPVEGAANAALVSFLVKTLGVSRASVTLASGAGARLKLIDIAGCDPLSLQRALGGPPAGAAPSPPGKT